jgi:hypothetical protein
MNDADRPADGVTAGLLTLLRDACAAGRVGPEELAGALGLRLRPGYLGYAEAEPPPGTDEIVFALEDAQGPVRSVNVVVARDAPVRLSDIETVLVGKQARPLLHVGDPERFGYEHVDARSGRTCMVSIDLRGEASGSERLVGALSIIL